MNYIDIIKTVAHNRRMGLETAIVGQNGDAIKYGFNIRDPKDLPDTPERCELIPWNNEVGIDGILAEFCQI